MEKYIILIVILFLLLLYLNKHIEGYTPLGWKGGVIEGRKQFSVKDISQTHTFSRNVSASVEMIPTSRGSILHPSRASQLPYNAKIIFFYIFY